MFVLDELVPKKSYYCHTAVQAVQAESMKTRLPMKQAVVQFVIHGLHVGITITWWHCENAGYDVAVAAWQISCRQACITASVNDTAKSEKRFSLDEWTDQIIDWWQYRHTCLTVTVMRGVLTSAHSVKYNNRLFGLLNAKTKNSH